MRKKLLDTELCVLYACYIVSDKRKEMITLVDTAKLAGIIRERGKTQAMVAEDIGITPKTFYNKMQKKVFDSDEISKMISYLNISINDAPAIFFSDLSRNE